MGWNRDLITKVMVYELVASTMAAVFLGYASGVVVSFLGIAQFHIIVELPMKAELPWNQMAVVFVFSIISLIFGGRYGTSLLF